MVDYFLSVGYICCLFSNPIYKRLYHLNQIYINIYKHLLLQGKLRICGTEVHKALGVCKDPTKPLRGLLGVEIKIFPIS